MAAYRFITQCTVGKRQGMARYLPQVFSDILEDGNPIKAETRNIENLSAKQNTIKIKKGVSPLARCMGQEGYTFL